MINIDSKGYLGGEYRMVVKRKDGSVKFDSGKQSNLVLDNAFKFYFAEPPINSNGVVTGLSVSTFSYMMNTCLVGDGSVAPANEDYKLQSFVAAHGSRLSTSSGRLLEADGAPAGHAILYEEVVYSFLNIQNKNITELGLACYYGVDIDSSGTSVADTYVLCTRALVKDNTGTPIAVTVLPDEILEVTYRLNMYVPLSRTYNEIQLTTTDNTGTTTDTLEYFHQVVGLSTSPSISSRTSIYGCNQPTAYLVSVANAETDDVLDATYSIGEDNYPEDAILNDYTVWRAWPKVYTSQSSIVYDAADLRMQTTSNPAANNYIGLTHLSRTTVSNSVVLKYTIGAYSANFTNGIRVIGLYQGWNTQYLSNLLVFKNKANGRGIKKKLGQVLELTCTITLNRWTG